MRSFKNNENIHKKEGESYYVVSANEAASVTLQSPGEESQRKHTAILRIPNRQWIQSKKISNDINQNDINQNGVQINKHLSKI